MFGAALAQAQADPMLGPWLARAQAHDVSVAGKLAEIRPPAGLREAILAGARVSETSPAAWRRPVWLAMAAAAAVLIGVTASLWPNRAAAQQNQLADFALIDTATEEHGSHGEQAGALQAALSLPTTRLARGLASDFGKLKATGCRTVSFAGKDVLEVCFARGAQVFHFYAVRSADFPAMSAKGELAITHRNGLCCASWADAAGQFRFAVVSAADADAIRNLL